MIRGAIFDADGTLLDSMGIWEDLGARYLRRQGREPRPGLSATLFPMTLEESSAYLREQYHLPHEEAAIRQGILDTLADYYRQEVPLKSGVPAFLEQMHRHGLPMTIATTGDAELLEAALARLHVRQYFGRIFTCTELHTTKREPDIYLKAAAWMGTSPAETLVFEDVLHALHTAAAAGFPTVAVEDAASIHDREEIVQAAAIYLQNFESFDRFWALAQKL